MSNIEREDVRITESDGEAVVKVGDAEIRLHVRTDGEQLSVELDHHGEGPYWLLVDDDEDDSAGIVGEIEPLFYEDGDSDGS